MKKLFKNEFKNRIDSFLLLIFGLCSVSWYAISEINIFTFPNLVSNLNPKKFLLKTPFNSKSKNVFVKQ